MVKENSYLEAGWVQQANLKKPKAKELQKQPANGKLVVVLVRGMVDMQQPVKDTLAKMNLNRKNACVVLEDNLVSRGMLNKVNNCVTWGLLSEETFRQLLSKRGRDYKGRLEDAKGKYQYGRLEVDGKYYLRTFHLNPPRKGFGRKGIKLPFKKGGALGPREEKINDLILRML